MSLKKFRIACLRVREAEKAAWESMLVEIPEGARVHWLHGENRRTATVKMHSYDLRIWVRSDAGRNYWIDAHRVSRVSP